MDPILKAITRILTVLFVCVAGGLVSGCLYTFHGAPTQREPQPDLVEYRHDVEFPADRFSLSREQGQELEAFIARVGVGYGDRVYLATVTPQGPEGDSAARLAERRAESVSSFLGLNDVRRHVLLEDGEFFPRRRFFRLFAPREPGSFLKVPLQPIFNARPSISRQLLETRSCGYATADVLQQNVAVFRRTGVLHDPIQGVVRVEVAGHRVRRDRASYER